jgi:hypothetical protein
MSKVDLIKKRVSQWKTFDTVSVELWADDVLFLLSKLEIAETALEEITELIIEDKYSEALLKSNDALEQITEINITEPRNKICCWCGEDLEYEQGRTVWISDKDGSHGHKWCIEKYDKNIIKE